MLIMGCPQFETQDDIGIGDGIPPIPEWQLDPIPFDDSLKLRNLIVDKVVWNVFIRLRNVFQRARQIPFSNTQLHDLTCFVVHRLLLSTPSISDPLSSPMAECLRYGIILYMFIIHGPTYYSHAFILDTMVTRLTERLKQLDSTPNAFDVWLLSVGMVAASGTGNYQCFMERSSSLASSLHLSDWSDVLSCVKSILWLETLQGEHLFGPHWQPIFETTSQTRRSHLSESQQG